jgi:hypothetical protein
MQLELNPERIQILIERVHGQSIDTVLFDKLLGPIKSELLAMAGNDTKDDQKKINRREYLRIKQAEHRERKKAKSQSITANPTNEY